jgi:hypothetical protein
MRIIAGTIFLLTVMLAAYGQQYCEQVGSTKPREYPEMDSKCTMVQQGEDRTTISARFLGPQIRTNSSDPTCSFPATDVKCRRICGDLPKGKKPGKVIQKGISPDSDARFEDNLETFRRGDHWRVCMRVRNWANSGLNSKEYRLFSYSVDYAP